MNILITGGAGFIGTALTKKLISLGNEVTIIDLEEKINNCNKTEAKYIVVDITDYANFKPLQEISKIDIIYHLAAQTSGRISQENPDLDVETNAKGTLNITRFAREKNIKKIIFTSSMATYGNYDGSVDESFVQKPISNYGVTKVCGELFIRALTQYNIPHTIFRLFNVYGPGQDLKNMKQGMVSIFMSQSLLGSEISTTGSLKRYRDFVYIDDVVDALLLGLKDQTNNMTLNVGTEKKTTVKELIELIIKVNENRDNLSFKEVESHDGDQFGIISDSTQLKKLNWKPKTDMLSGISQMYSSAKRELLL